MTNYKEKKFSDFLKIWALAVGIGVALIGIIFTVSTKMDMRLAEKQLSGIVKYIKNQCVTYKITNLASETKSLMRMIESAQQIEQRLAEEGLEQNLSDVNISLLEECTQDCYLTGTLILDDSGKLIVQHGMTDEAKVYLEKYFQNESIINVTKYSEKYYAVRIPCDDGSYIDMSAVGCTDTAGVVMVFYHTPLAYIQAYSSSFQDILSGYNEESDGTVVVTRDDRVIACNDENLIGKNIEDINILKNLNQHAYDGKMKMVRTDVDGIGRSFGMIDRGRDYYIYAYMSEREVFSTTPQNFVIVVISYCVILLFIQFVRWKTAQKYTDEQIRKEKVYQEKLLDASEKAESANHAKTEFLQRMSHDIRTPINGIRGMVEIGDYYADDMEKQAECRKKIREASGLLLELFNEVLDMGKLESGEIILEARVFNIQVILNEIIDIVEKQAQERNITITCKDNVITHPNLVGSPLHVKRLLMNILSNSVKYNRDNGTVTLCCEETAYSEHKTQFVFTCTDTGIGMSESFLQHIFEPFTQEGQSARTKYGGTGLGMAIVKALVDKMGGTIEVESTRGVGSEFRVTIPFEIAPKEEVMVEQQSDEDVSIEGVRILLAEDNELNQEIITALLENQGAHVELASNGTQTLEAFEIHPAGTYDVILMDIMMPVMDGLEATRHIRALERSDAKTIPIIALTANAFNEDVQKSKQAGMNAHLTKPIDLEKMVSTFAHFYAKR